MYEQAIEDYNRALKVNKRYREATNNRRLAQQKLKEKSKD